MGITIVTIPTHPHPICPHPYPIYPHPHHISPHPHACQKIQTENQEAQLSNANLPNEAKWSIYWYVETPQVRRHRRKLVPAANKTQWTHSAVILVNFTQQFPVPIPAVLPRWSLSHPHGDTATFVPVIAVFPLFSSRCRCLVQATTVDKLWWVECSGLVVEYRTRNREVAGSTHTRSTASNLEQVANLLCAQANSAASYLQRDGKWVVTYLWGLRDENLVWLIGSVVCLLAAPRVQMSISTSCVSKKFSVRSTELFPPIFRWYFCQIL